MFVQILWFSIKYCWQNYSKNTTSLNVGRLLLGKAKKYSLTELLAQLWTNA